MRVREGPHMKRIFKSVDWSGALLWAILILIWVMVFIVAQTEKVG